MVALFADVEPRSNLIAAGPHNFRVGEIDWTVSQKSGGAMLKLGLAIAGEGDAQRGKRKNVYLTFGENAIGWTFQRLMAVRPDMTKDDWKAFQFPYHPDRVLAEARLENKDVTEDEAQAVQQQRINELTELLVGQYVDADVKHKPSTRPDREADDDIGDFYPAGSRTGVVAAGSW